ncbi:(2Fe-2S)-binding protein [Teredinibacter turnerae]|uniref:Bacterioferritin-associated ferredoxin n=1 Tax=Teredinibacter turnerae (strain ATCC 39867 / T7901) TaxID=377629 RepID=C5BTD9_TERTT|nr:bacterioferritin-associated ferredoxin [Teredinibacter turnerae T7901]
MYICLCNAVTEKQVAEAIANGARCMKDLRHHLGVTKTCGRCAQCASECLRNSVASLENYNNQCNLAEAS